MDDVSDNDASASEGSRVGLLYGEDDGGMDQGDSDHVQNLAKNAEGDTEKALGTPLLGNAGLDPIPSENAPSSVLAAERGGEARRGQASRWNRLGRFVPFRSGKGSYDSDMADNVPQSNNGIMNVGALVLTMTLGVNSFIAGLALGTMRDADDFFAFAIAVLAHKFFAAMALGVAFIVGRYSLREAVPFLFLFSMSTPAGILIGMAAERGVQGNAAELIVALISAAASGAFVYIGVIDIAVHELVSSKHKGVVHAAGIPEDISKACVRRRFWSLCGGAILMALIAIFL